MGDKEVSIVVPTLDRKEELDACLTSLEAQTCQDFETILIRERGPLAALRNQGLQRAHTPVVSFIDDDVVCTQTWVENLIRVSHEFPSVVGITGPAIIPKSFKRNRDILKYPFFRNFYDWFFLHHESRPGHLTLAGTFVPEPDYTYKGSVQFLEACNMSFKMEALKAVGGFDEAYGGIGDWSEPDFCFRLRQRFGTSCLYFDPSVALEHRPSLGGAYLFRGYDARQRLSNYQLFASRWVTPTWRHWLYRRFLEAYYLGWQPLKGVFHACTDYSG